MNDFTKEREEREREREEKREKEREETKISIEMSGVNVAVDPWLDCLKKKN